MVRFNIIGHGFLDLAYPSGVAFKTENPFFRFAEVSLGRSTEFSVPATDHNRKMLGFGEDAAETGEMLRRVFPSQMVYDGGLSNGTIAVTGFSSDAFTCVFTFGNAEWVDALQNMKLSDCLSSWDKGVTWGPGVPTDADAADPTDGADIVKYENGYSGGHWQCVPSVNVNAYIGDILTNLGITHDIVDLSTDYWMVAGSMKGGDRDDVTLTQTDYTSFSFVQTQDYVEVVDIGLEWADMNLFGALVGGGSVTSKAFRAKQDIEITFPNTLSGYNYLIQWDSKLKRCKTLGATFNDSYGATNLNGATLTLKKGYVFFFASRPAPDHYGGILPYYGFKDTDIVAISLTAIVVRDGDLGFGEVWYMRNNHPDMTVFEFLKSVCVATGLELIVDGSKGVSIVQGSYGQAGDFSALGRVVSIDSVTRRVESWGNGTHKAVVAFDSEEYVAQPLESAFDIDNDQQQEKKEVKSKFSEGNVGTYGVLIEDVDASSGTPKFKGKKWTLALATSASTYLQRVMSPDPVGYDDISANSTAMQVRLAAQLDDFFKLTPSKTWTWRGSAFVWTDASWSDGILTMTLQRVSQMAQVAPTPPPPPPTLLKIKVQFNQGGAVVIGTDSLDSLKPYLTVTAVYSDSSERLLGDGEYTLSGTLAYPSATVTVDYQGETDTFTVAVAYDAQVEYLESTGTQYINLGITPLANEVVKVRFGNSQNTSFAVFIGSRYGVGNRQCYIGYYNGNFVASLGSQNSTAIATADNGDHEISLNTANGLASIDGNPSVVAGSFVSSSFDLCLFALNTNGSIGNKANVNIKDVEVGARMVLVSVRCGTTGYMYDRVSGTLFGNDGTGDFIVGPDV